jgi:hypothetical protein
MSCVHLNILCSHKIVWKKTFCDLCKKDKKNLENFLFLHKPQKRFFFRKLCVQT